jgi:hypothetical protein
MSIPRKGSRKISVDGRDFIYIIKESKGYDDTLNMKMVVVTVQEDIERPGRVFQFSEVKGVEITPSLMETKISLALRKGWKPNDRGAAYNLPNS